MSSILKVTPLILSVVLLISCAKKHERDDVQNSDSTASMSEAKSSPDVDTAKEVTKDQQLTSTAATYSDAERKFIRTATLHFDTRDVYQSALAIEDAVAAQGGFVTKNDIKSNVYDRKKYSDGRGLEVDASEYIIEGEMIVRVPSQKAQDFLRSIIAQIDFLESRNFEARDAQFDVLHQQLEASRQQALQAQLQQLAAQKGNVEQKSAVLDASLQSAAARDEAQLKQKEFEDQIAFATITIQMQQPTKIRKTENMNLDQFLSQNRPDFFPLLTQSLVNGWYGFLDFMIIFSRFWTLWLFIAITFFVVRWVRKRRRLKRIQALEGQSKQTSITEASHTRPD